MNNDMCVVSDMYDGRRRVLHFHNCAVCNKEFLAPKKANAKYCSRTCYYISKQSREILCCATCGKQFYSAKSKSKNSKSGFRFCSRMCKDQAQRIDSTAKLRPPHYGTGKSSYRTRALRSRENVCEGCGLSKWLGQDISLDVHHVDGNRDNNSIHNLKILCPNCHRIEEMKKRGASDYG